MGAAFYIPTNRAEGLQFPHIVPNTSYVLLFDSNHPSACEVGHHVFHLAFSFPDLRALYDPGLS